VRQEHAKGDVSVAVLIAASWFAVSCQPDCSTPWETNACIVDDYRVTIESEGASWEIAPGASASIITSPDPFAPDKLDFSGGLDVVPDSFDAMMSACAADDATSSSCGSMGYSVTWKGVRPSGDSFEIGSLSNSEATATGELHFEAIYHLTYRDFGAIGQDHFLVSSGHIEYEPGSERDQMAFDLTFLPNPTYASYINASGFQGTSIRVTVSSTCTPTVIHHCSDT